MMNKMLCFAALAAFVACVSGDIQKNFCPERALGATKFPAGTYARVSGSYCYALVLEEEIGWHDAESFCVARGGHLASVISEDVKNFLVSMVKNDAHLTKGNMWIGLNDYDENKKYEWLDGQAYNYTNWENNKEPSGAFTYIQDCVSMDVNGFWDDHNCYKDFTFFMPEYKFFCQYKV